METDSAASNSKDFSEEKLTSFLESSPDGMIIINNEGYIEFANAQTEKIFGYRRHELLGKKIEILIPSGYEFRHVLSELPEARTIREGRELFGKTKDGKEIPVEISLSPIDTTDGMAVSATIRDVTEKRKIQLELKKTKERYDYVTKATSDVIWDWDIQTDTIYRSESFNLTFGHNELLSTLQLRLNLIHPQDRGRVEDGLQRALKEKVERWSDEYRFLCANGNYKTVLDKGFIIRDEKGNAIRMIGAMQDVTEQRKMQLQLKQREQKKKREIMQAIMAAQENERFEISHELHDNVSQILTTCKLLLEAAAGQQNENKYLERSKENIQKAIDEIRNISHRLNPATLKYIGLHGAIDDLVTNINNAGKVHVAFSSSLKAEERIIEDVELAVFRIVQEQLTNILKHSDAHEVVINLTRDEKKIKLAIVDDGKGHDLQIKKHGLGLKNIFNRAEFYRGRAEVFSEPGKGFRLQVEIPIPLA